MKRQVGAVTLLVLLVLLLLVSVMGVIAIRAATSDVTLAGAERRSRSAFYCAEAGLNAARSYFAANQLNWNAMFAGQVVAGYPVTGDIDGDGVVDYSVTLKDNVDEFPPAANNPLVDNDLTAIMVSQCTSNKLFSRSLEEFVTFNGRGTDYRAQAGHSSRHTGNEN